MAMPRTFRCRWNAGLPLGTLRIPRTLGTRAPETLESAKGSCSCELTCYDGGSLLAISLSAVQLASIGEIECCGRRSQ